MSSDLLQHPPPKHRRLRATLFRYVAREAFVPTLFALLGLTIVMLTANFLGYSELVINRGVNGADILRMALCDAIPVAGQILPFAMFVGVLVALGRLGADREILVLEASGVAAARLVWPVVSFAGVMTLVALLLSVYATPWASRSFDTILEEVSRTKPWAQLEAGQVNEFGGWQLEAREALPAGDELRGVMLFVPDAGETLFARHGSLGAGEGGAIELTLRDGVMLLRPKADQARVMRFESATTLLPDSDSGLRRGNKQRLAGLPIDVLMRRAAAWKQSENSRVSWSLLALHRRFAFPAATLCFGFLAVPLFLARGRFSRASGGVMGLLCTIVYFSVVQFSDGVIRRGTFSVGFGAWFPNLLLVSVALLLLLRALRERVAGYNFDGRRRRWRLPRRKQRPAPELQAWRGRPHRLALARYVSGRFLQLAALTFSVLFVAYFMIDLMERLSWFARHEATSLEIVRFYSARVWLLASRAVPMSLLIATALTVSLLAVEGELIGMRACGIPAVRGMLPVLLLAASVAPLYFLLNNVVVPRTNAIADDLKVTEIKGERSAAKNELKKAGLWARSGSQLLQAGYFDTDLGHVRDVTLYELGEHGMPTARTDAARGRHIGDGWWRFIDPTRVELNGAGAKVVDAPLHQQLGEIVAAEVDTMHLPVHRIAEEARAIEADGFPATEFWVDYQVRLAEPFACVVLPVLMLLFAVAGPPFPGPAQTLLVSGIVGVAYILLGAVSSSLGRGDVISPVAAAWGPVALASLATAFYAARVWRRL
ncbi:MAG: LptF/LptG family permease [Deltaproteobacteria bacterium]|nr:LptF/LptG family permease [Deltaproteobacteria bacterium]MBW2359837.1 LptF/LptG family permease [Deltaproteobacteria bacterium]